MRGVEGVGTVGADAGVEEVSALRHVDPAVLDPALGAFGDDVGVVLPADVAPAWVEVGRGG